MNWHKTDDFGRVSTRQLLARRARLAGRARDLGVVLAGTLVAQSRRCGKAGCRCAAGDLHGPYTYLSVSVDGAPRLRYVPADLVGVVSRRLAATAALDAALAEIAAVNAELLARRELD
jgi:Family of unknown function (DUF6788)